MALEEDTRHFDFIIFGATGFTGKYCIEYMIKCQQKLGSNYNWAIAGRNASRLINARNEVAAILGVNLDEIPVIVADIDDEDSVFRMCKQCSVVINCVGPYTLYGEIVVKACIKARTHQVDLTGEEHYVCNMQLKYNKQAQEAGVFIVNFCGFGSLVWEVGINHLKDQIKPKVLNSVEIYVAGLFSSSLHQGNFDSMIEVFSNLMEFIRVRNRLNNEIYTKPMPVFDYPHRKRMLPFYLEERGGWCVNTSFLQGESAHRMQHYNYMEHNERPAQSDCYFVFPTFISLLVSIYLTFLVLLFTRCSSGIRLLTNYAKCFTFGVVSKEGPTRDEVMRSSFEVTLLGNGWRNEKETSKVPDVKCAVVIKGPNPTYVSASICMIIGAITIREEIGTEGFQLKGGVFTPGVAFRNTQIVERLSKNAIIFSVIE